MEERSTKYISRDIRFRGLLLCGEWVEGNLAILYKKQGHVEAGTYISNSCGVPFAYDIRPETLGQYSGLPDSKGVDIFEKDYVYLHGYGNYLVEFPFTELYEASPEGDIGEILGNAFDNPEPERS